MERTTILEDLLKAFASSVPSFGYALLIIIIGWIIAKIIAKIVKRVLKSIGINKIGDRLNEIEIVSKANMKIVLSDVLAKMIYYVLMLFVIVAATDVLGIEEVSNLMSSIIKYVPLLLSGLIMLGIGVLLADFIKDIVLTACKSIGLPSANIIASFVFWFVFLTALVSAMAQAEINTDFITSNLSIIIGGGVLAFALGYGFASKDMMANFLASFYSKDRFQIGDTISIEGVSGEIIEIDNSALVLRADNKKIIIPLSKLTSEKVEVHDS